MKINHVIKTLIISDFFINSGFALLAPIFAIFIADQITGGLSKSSWFCGGYSSDF